MNKEELEDLLSIGCCRYHEEIGEKAKKEIERLKKEVEDRNSINLACYMLRDDNRELYSRLEKLKSIIKEVREYIEHAQNYGKEKILYINGNDILEILDKVEENK